MARLKGTRHSFAVLIGIPVSDSRKKAFERTSKANSRTICRRPAGGDIAESPKPANAPVRRNRSKQ
jgi:hypothetical protein